MIFLLILANVVNSAQTSAQTSKSLIDFLQGYSQISDCNFVYFDFKSRGDFHDQLQTALTSSGNYNPTFITSFQSANETLELTSHRTNYRHARWCNVMFLDLTQIGVKDDLKQLSDNLFETFTKRFGTITRKDEDHYFILAKKLYVDGLIAERFFQKIKFKIIFFEEPSNPNEVNAVRSKFFPWPGEDLKIPFDFQNQIHVPNFGGLFPDLLNNFEGRKIRITSPLRLLYTLEIDEDNGVWRTKRGHQKKVLDEIQRVFNFTYDLMVSSGGGGTGYKLANGTYIGTISDLYYERADLALFTGQLVERYPMIGYSKPFYFPGFVFTTAIPKKIYSYKLIFKPLKENLWFLFLGTNLIFLGLFLLSNKYEGPLFHGTRGYWEFSKILEFSVGSIFEQGLTLQRKKSGRIFGILFLFFLMVFSTAYKARLFTFLIYPELDKPPETFTELTQSDYKFGLERAGIGAAIHSTLKISPNPTFAKINKEMSMERDSIKCFLKGLFGNFACLAYREQVEYIFYKNFSTASRKYPFQISKEKTFTPHACGFAFEKRSVFRTNFNRVFAPLNDGGFIDQMEREDFDNLRLERVKWQKEEGIKPIFTDDYFYNGPKKISIRELNGIFLFYSIFILISILGLIMEKIVSYLSVYRCRNNEYDY